MRLLAWTVAVAVAPVTAVAAEVTASQPAGQPIVYNWSGLHIGVFGGQAQGDVRATELFTTAFGGNFYAPTANRYGFEDNVAIFGGQVGYDWQRSWAVFGVAADLGQMNVHGSIADPNFLPVPQPEVRPATSVDYGLNGAVTARLGFALDRVLIYARGGVAFVEAKGSTVDICSRSFCGIPTITATGDDVLAGFAMGGGFELALSHHWRFGTEYRYYDFEDLKVSGVSVPNNLRYSQNIALDGLHTGRVFANFRW